MEQDRCITRRIKAIALVNCAKGLAGCMQRQSGKDQSI